MSLSVKFQGNPLTGLSLAAFLLMACNHVIGAIGLNNQTYQSLFENLAGVNLLLSFFLVIPFHQPLNRNLFLFCIIAFVIGMAAEIVGVTTGYPFGNYYYTETFGPQVFKVPIIIGFNWVMLSYVTAVVIKDYIKGEFAAMLAASALMVIIDLLLERFAIRHNFWVWQASTPPLQNYFSWFFVSLLIQFVYRKLIPASQNVNALPYLTLLMAFLLFDFVFTLVQRTFF